MKGKLLCVIVETAAAEYLRPLFEDWIVQPPAFGWHIAAGPAAARVLSEIENLSKDTVTRIDPKHPLPAALTGPGDSGPSVLIVSAAAWPVEISAVRAGRAAGAQVLQIVDNWYGYRWRVSDGADLVLGDRLLVIDQTAKTEAEREGIPGEVLAPVGHPAWEKTEPLPPTQSKDILFLGAPVARDYGKSLGYTESDSWALLCEARRLHADLFGRIFYAPHPTMDIPADLGDAEVVRYRPGLLRDVGTVAGMFSAPLVEAFLAKRRVLTLQPNAVETDMCALSRHQYISRIGTVEALISAMTVPLPDPEALAARFRGSRRRVAQLVERALAA